VQGPDILCGLPRLTPPRPGYWRPARTPPRCAGRHLYLPPCGAGYPQIFGWNDNQIAPTWWLLAGYPQHCRRSLAAVARLLQAM